MSTFEALAVAALRRWCAERAAMRNGQVTHLSARGYQARSQRAADARLVRVSFEQAFSTLAECQQSALLLVYRDGLSTDAVSTALQLPYSTTRLRIAGARLRLANALDRRDLL